MERVLQSSRILSISSKSASSSSTCVDVKKLVGGICLLSPTQIKAFPLAMAPTASLVGICEASSKMTRSNLSVPRSRNWATESGLISIQGQRRGSSVGMLSMIARIDVPRPPLLMLRFRILISEPSDDAAAAEGTCEARRL